MVRQQRRCDADLIASALRGIAAPIFAAAWSSTKAGDLLFVHVASAPERAVLRTQIAEALKAAGVEQIKIRFHNAAQLHAPRSLEKLVARFAGDEIVYDPTGSVARAKALVAASAQVRSSLTEKLFGIFYAPRLRTVFVSLKASSLLVGDKVKVTDLASVERAVVAAMTGVFAPKMEDCPAVRVGFGLPQANLVAVDRKSVVRWSTRFTAAVRRLWKPVTLAALFGFGMTATASADGGNGGREPAVSQTNLKLSGFAGETDGENSWQAQGALTAPVGKWTGVALEGGAMGVDDDTAWGAAGHLFTRDPDKYLLGVFAAYGKQEDWDIDLTLVGAEAELYMKQVSILAKAGYQFSDTLGDKAFGDIDLRWYATDNFWIGAGGHFEEDVTQGRLQAEFMPGLSALPGLAFNVQGVIGDDDYDSVMGGITYYFGADASLKDRHRKQDPDSALFGLFQKVEQERQRLEAIYGQPPSP